MVAMRIASTPAAPGWLAVGRDAIACSMSAICHAIARVSSSGKPSSRARLISETRAANPEAWLGIRAPVSVVDIIGKCLHNAKTAAAEIKNLIAADYKKFHCVELSTDPIVPTWQADLHDIGLPRTGVDTEMGLSFTQLLLLLTLVGAPTVAGTVLYYDLVSPYNWIYQGGPVYLSADYKHGGLHNAPAPTSYAPAPAIGEGAGLAVLAVSAYWLIKRRRRKDEESNSDSL
jgi:hypothetical protein